MAISKCEQVKEFIRQKIDGGKLRPNQSVPSLSDISSMFSINRNTAAKALNDLSAEGKIYQVRGVGSFVSPKNSRAKSKNLGILVYNIASPIFSKIINSIGDSCHEHNYNLIPCSIYASREKECQVLKDFADNNKIDGLIVFPSHGGKEEISLLKDFQSKGIPVMCHILHGKIDPLSTIGFDYDSGSIKSLEHLISRGYNKIGFVTEAYASSATMQRYYGYRLGLEKNNLPFREDYIFQVDDPEERYGYEIADEFINHPDRPEALIVSSDEIAIGMINRMHECGLKVPGDVAITAGGDTELGAHPLYSLTTIAPDFRAMGKAITDNMMELISKPSNAPKNLIFEQRLIVRGSSQKNIVNDGGNVKSI